MSQPSIYTSDLDTCPANYTPLSPLSFIDRAADVYPELTAIIHGNQSQNWSETRKRCLQLASALASIGVDSGDTVAIIAPNIPALFEAHFGVPMCGAVLNAINTRLDAATIAFILEHGEAKVLLTDTEYFEVVSQAIASMDKPPIVIDIEDTTEGQRLGTIEYEEFLQTGSNSFTCRLPADEWDAISLNYTSGTTGNPKGVVYHHRGAYLNALSNITGWQMTGHPQYLWTLPMFHCNGWCFPWTLAAVAGTSICTRTISGPVIHQAIREHRVTHMCGAPMCKRWRNYVSRQHRDERVFKKP